MGRRIVAGVALPLGAAGAVSAVRVAGLDHLRDLAKGHDHEGPDHPTTRGLSSILDEDRRSLATGTARALVNLEGPLSLGTRAKELPATGRDT